MRCGRSQRYIGQIKWQIVLSKVRPQLLCIGQEHHWKEVVYKKEEASNLIILTHNGLNKRNASENVRYR